MDIPFEGQFNGYGVNPGAQAAAPAVDATAAANRAARVGKFGAATVDAMEAAGRAPANMAAPNLVTPPTATGVSAAPRFAVPSWLKTAGGFGAKLMRGFGVAGGLSAAAEYGGPLLESAFKFGADKIAGATGSNMSPNPAVQAAQPAPVAAPVAEIAPVGDDQVAMGQKNLATAMQPGFGGTATPDNTAVPALGTGFIKNNQTGAVTQIDSRGKGYGAAPVRDYTGGSPAASFFQASAFLKNNADNNALAIAQAKAGSDAVAKGAEAASHIATAENLRARNAVGAKMLASGDLAGAAGAFGGRGVGSGNVFHESTTSLPGKNGEITTVNARTNEVTRVTPKQPITMAEAIASAKKNKTYSSDAQVRADIQKMQGYKLTD